MFSSLRIICIEETRHVAYHIHAKLAVEIYFSLVKGSYSDTYLHTHIYQNINTHTDRRINLVKALTNNRQSEWNRIIERVSNK